MLPKIDNKIVKKKWQHVTKYQNGNQLAKQYQNDNQMVTLLPKTVLKW